MLVAKNFILTHSFTPILVLSNELKYTTNLILSKDFDRFSPKTWTFPQTNYNLYNIYIINSTLPELYFPTNNYYYHKSLKTIYGALSSLLAHTLKKKNKEMLKKIYKI